MAIIILESLSVNTCLCVIQIHSQIMQILNYNGVLNILQVIFNEENSKILMESLKNYLFVF